MEWKVRRGECESGGVEKFDVVRRYGSAACGGLGSVEWKVRSVEWGVERDEGSGIVLTTALWMSYFYKRTIIDTFPL